MSAPVATLVRAEEQRGHGLVPIQAVVRLLNAHARARPARGLPGACVGRLRAERENAELVEDSRAV
jgi:hypothetical protein